MLETHTTTAERRLIFRQQLQSGQLVRFVGAFNSLCAMLIEEIGFDGVYISGAVVAASSGLPDIGLTTASEVSERGLEVTRMTGLPVIADGDTGFGEPMNVARTIQMFEDAGLSGCHIEDQEMPKRCGHLDGKVIVEASEMRRRIRAATMGRRDDNFVIIARTDARAIEGLSASIDRAKLYVDAGADVIFPEALRDASEFEAFRSAIDVPILANMTEFGVTPLLPRRVLEDIGVNIVIYPVTALRLAMYSVEAGLRTLFEDGDQGKVTAAMQTRNRLYELVRYSSYKTFDDVIFDFKVPGP